MNFGHKVFLPKEQQLKPSLYTFSKDLTSDEVRATVQANLAQIDPIVERKAQLLATRYGVGTNSTQVLSDLRRLRNNTLNRDNDLRATTGSYYREGYIDKLSSSLDHKGVIHGNCSVVIDHPLTATSTVQLDHQRLGGRHYVPSTADPYHSQLMVSHFVCALICSVLPSLIIVVPMQSMYLLMTKCDMT